MAINQPARDSPTRTTLRLQVIVLWKRYDEKWGLSVSLVQLPQGHNPTLPVERGWTQPPESLVAKVKGQVEDSPAVEEIWDEWPSPFAKLEKQWDDIYQAEFPEVTAAPRIGSGGAAACSDFTSSTPPTGPIGQGPLPPLSPTTTAAVNALCNLASHGWDIMTTRCVWWTLAAAREYKTAREIFEYRLQELQWVDNMSRTVAAALGFWLSSAERLAALMGPGRTSLREFLSGVYPAGQALLGTTVATAVPSRPVAAPAAPREPSTFAPPTGLDSPSALPGTPEVTTPPPPLPDLRTEEFRVPESSVTVRDLPQQLGTDGLLNGSVGRSPADDASAATDDKEKGPSAELSGTEQPPPKRARTLGK
ncbi:hypothetical protein Emag_003590 [Eimeria magna]